MAESRLRCETPGCENTILKATAKRTGGYCGPCHGKILKAKQEEYIRQNRRDVDLYAGVIDPVEIIRLAQQNRPYDPLIHYLPPPRGLEEFYVLLTLPQAERLMILASQSLRNGDKCFAENLARSLAAFTGYNLDLMLETWIELGQFWPPIAFRSAGDKIRDGILDALRNGNVDANHALQAAAWIGDEVVINAFEAFDAFPPYWAKSLYIPPSGYARTAGWELVSGRRNELSLGRCFSIIPVLQESERSDVCLFQPTQDCCAWCGSELVNLLRIGASAVPFSTIGLSGNCFEVKTCSRCTCFGFVFAELDAGGQGHWARGNVRPDLVQGKLEPWARSKWGEITVRFNERRTTHAADNFLPTTYTQIGGLPAWVQDLAYPNCCNCGKTMLVVAQIDNSLFRDDEGMYYAFLCRDCRVTATTFQQT
ncbi:MAG: hypothetical protein WCI73_13600 [Phycisphaerae bacterium]